MKLSLEHYETKVSVEHTRDDLNILEVLFLVYSLLQGAGFAAGEYIPEMEAPRGLKDDHDDH